MSLYPNCFYMKILLIAWPVTQSLTWIRQSLVHFQPLVWASGFKNILLQPRTHIYTHAPEIKLLLSNFTSIHETNSFKILLFKITSQFSRSVMSDSAISDCSTPGFSVYHQLPELAQTHVHGVGDAIQPSHPLSSPSPALNPSQHQSLFQWVNSSCEVAKVLEFQL